MMKEKRVTLNQLETLAQYMNDRQKTVAKETVVEEDHLRTRFN
jgi:hypothetical protein